MPRRERDECRPIELADGQVVVVRGRGELSSAGVEALTEIVQAAQRYHESLHPPDPAATALYARLECVHVARGVTWRELSRLAGVPASLLTRLAQGSMPAGPELDALETWLAREESTRVGSSGEQLTKPAV